MIIEDIEIGTDVQYNFFGGNEFFVFLTILLSIAIVFAARLILNGVMRKKGIIPKINFSAKRLNLIYIGVTAAIFALVYGILYFSTIFQNMCSFKNIIAVTLILSLSSYIISRKILQVRAEKRSEKK